MKKMPCLFVREFKSHREFTITPVVTPGCEWVLEGQGVPSRKRDGTACAVINGLLYKRYDAKKGKIPPIGAIPCDEPNAVTGHHPHWLLVGDEPESKWHREAWEQLDIIPRLLDGTYELCGPKFSANPERFERHTFVRHGAEVLHGIATVYAASAMNFDTLRTYLELTEIEGIVWAHPDGRMCKLRRADFGFPWGSKK